MRHSCRFVTVLVLGIGIATAAVAFHRFDGPGWHAHHWRATPVERQARMVERAGEALQLDPMQRRRLTAVLDELWLLRNDFRGDRGTLMTLLGQPSLDRQQAQALIDTALQRMEQRSPELVDAVAGFADSLSAVQKATLLDWLQHRGGRLGFGH